MSKSELLFGWIFPIAFLFLPVWNWHVRRRLSGRAESRARSLLDAVRRTTEEIPGASGPELDSPVAIFVRRWHLATLLARPLNLAMLTVMLYWANSVMSRPIPPERSFRDTAKSVASDLPSLSGLARGAFTLAFVALIFWVGMTAAERAFRSSGLPDHTRPAPRISARNAPTYWPAVALLYEAAECGLLRRQYAEAGPADLPHISLRSTERIVRRAWRVRSAPNLPRRWRRKELRDHAAEVIGALRYEEARQEIDLDDALNNLTRMLVTIAERYAEGRTMELLERKDLDKATPVYDYPLLRLLVSGALVLGALALSLWAGVPETVVFPAVLLATAVVVVFVYRAPVPGWSFLMALFSRR
ncbi:hypothetical protein [Streptomyces decoyicus]|uniref:hypothetical protein n=1 Tax=Streptomyces decoyicus TaxID=249567 RepID=UPI0033B70B84